MVHITQAAIAHEQVNDLSDHPSVGVRILLFTLPYLFVLITTLLLNRRKEKIMDDYFIYPHWNHQIIEILRILAFLGLALIGLYAVIADAWTTKAWVLFTLACIFLGIADIVYVAKNLVAVLIAAIFVIVTVFLNQALYDNLASNMLQDNTDHLNWKQVSLNFISFIEAILVVYAEQLIGELLVYGLRFSKKCQAIFYWISTPIVLLALLIWNSTNPAFIDTIGLLVAAIALLAGAAINTLFFTHDQHAKKQGSKL